MINAVDVAGPYSGIIIGISNSLGSFSGILAPLVANILTHDRTIMQWRTCFIVFSSVLLLAGLIFLLFSKADLEDWAKDEKNLNLKENISVKCDMINNNRIYNNSIRGLPSARKNQTQKLCRQFSLDSSRSSSGGLVPSLSIDDRDSYNHVVIVKNPKINNQKLQNL